jgi:hypothetical protein
MTTEERDLFISYLTEQRRGLLAQAAACERMLQVLKRADTPPSKMRYNMREEAVTMTMPPVWEKEGS